MIADGSGLELLNLPEDFYSEVAFETSYGDLFFWKVLERQLPAGHQYIASPTKCISRAENHGFLSSEKSAPGLWAHLFLREMYLLYLIIFSFVNCFFEITVQTIDCFHLAKCCWKGACQGLQFSCVMMNCSQENLQIFFFCSGAAVQMAEDKESEHIRRLAPQQC